MIIFIERNGDEVLLRVTDVASLGKLDLVVDHKHGDDEENREAKLQCNKNLSREAGPFPDSRFALQYFHRLETRQIEGGIAPRDNAGNEDQSQRKDPELLTGVVNE